MALFALFDIDELFALAADDVVLLLKIPLDTLLASSDGLSLFVSDSVSATLRESESEDDRDEDDGNDEESSEEALERRVNIEANRRLVDARSLRGLDGFEPV